MPAYHVLSRPTSEYKFVAYLFQMDTRSNIQYYQRNDGLFNVLLPAMVRLGPIIKHFHWADEAYGDSSSIKRLRYRHGLSFKYLNSINLCLSLPSDPYIPLLRPGQRSNMTCWSILGSCLDRVRPLQEISLCFEMSEPRVGLDALIDALDECLFDKDVQLPQLTSLNLRDAAGRRSPLLDILLGKFLIRYAPTLRHLSFRRWYVSQNLLLRLSASEKLQLESIKVDNADFESGADINESDLLAFLNNRRPTWPLPFGQVSLRSTIGADDKFMETPGVCDWANPKFANIPKGMDFCAGVLKGTPSDEEDDEGFEPSECTDASDSESGLDSDADPDDDFGHQSESGGTFELTENAGTG
ncbi:hypothetical protein UCDDA912_g00954 [Diaporthe ampelina]|uniref:Uncharacterized protein n=1 Tax=Diaporthe ampelina TaxID=1214573 RepID=A0A0G2FY29_9PEZI|nr:hypothetical protein UCDDA912_g00954 [Diaporthe ampelina]